MNIKGGNLSFLSQPAGHSFEKAHYTPVKETIPKRTKGISAEKTPVEQQIEQFREEQSSVGKRVDQIMGKFRSGKELTEEELEYLAKYSPECYKEVREVMQEREQMEQQMKMAKTKAEVAAVCMNTLAQIKDTMGTGATAKRMASKTMARANQINAAHLQFTASAEYKAKEDEKSQAEDIKEEVLEDKEFAEEITENRQEDTENMEENADLTKESEIALDSVINSEEVDYEEITEHSEKVNERIERQAKKRKRKKKPLQPAVLDIDIETIRKKTRDLYHNTSPKSTLKGNGTTSKNVDITV